MLPARRPLGDRGRASLALVATAFLFGTTFLVVQDAVEEADPLAFLTVRFAFGLLVLAPLAVWRRQDPDERRPAGLAAAGVRAGLFLAAGYVLQTVGLQYTTSTVSAFLTYLLVVFVPLLVAVAQRRLPPAATGAGVALAVAGLVLIGGGGEGVGAGRGELLTLGCALAFALHIIVLGESAPRFDLVRLNLVQFATVVALLAVPGLVLGGYDLPASAWVAAAYLGVTVTALAFGLQAYGQRRVSATRTALLLLLEPVFAGILGLAAGERLGAAGAFGALLILGGILVSELAAPVVPRPEDA